MKKIFSLLLIATIVSTSAFSDDLDNLFNDTDIIEDESSLFMDDDLFSDDSLFGNDDLFESESSTSSSKLILSDDLLSEEVTISGSYSFNFTTGLTYDFDDSSSLDYYSSSDISTELILSARPTTDTRFYTKASIAYPFFNTEDDDSTYVDEEYNFFSIDELFYDFLLNDSYFVRVGKQTLNMGVGYFYSPANLLNISTIDPLNAEDDQEGPLAIKINKPVGNDNLYGYLTFPNAEDYDPSEIGLAARVEKVINNGEYTLSGYYNYDQSSNPTKLAFTSSTSLFTDIDVFTEAVESYDGSEFNFEGTVGIQVLKEISELVDTSVTFLAQYYYNQNGSSNSITINNVQIPYDTTHQLSGLLSISLPNDLSFSLLSVNNLSQSSSINVANFSYSMNDDISITLGSYYYYGIDYITNDIQPYISFTIGEGDF